MLLWLSVARAVLDGLEPAAHAQLPLRRGRSGLGVVQRLNDVPVSGTKQIPQEKVKIVAAGEIKLAPPPPNDLAILWARNPSSRSRS